MPLIRLKKFTSNLLSVSIIKGCQIFFFLKTFSACLDMIMWGFLPSTDMVCYIN